ncbi:ATP-dependent sacrificial sulfur transferase LarE [Clostridia bacterium OttesenSCG-928-O13]|nr:ATP-dependent sacrificial sulfur transferase LarE [Clostridia bacterium OttesenSCG-928-O13]
MTTHAPAEEKYVPKALAAILRQTPRAALGFSGGVDSAYLLYAATACGVDVRPYYVKTAFQPAFELKDAQKLARLLDVDMTILPLDVLALPAVAENPADRCYHCKQAIFGAIRRRAADDGCPVLWDGSNADDDTEDRPGMRALAELSVASPLREAGLAKAEIREWSRKAGLFTWDKPAYACLATRVPTGTPLDAGTLAKVEQAEAAIAAMGFSNFRARVIPGGVKLQFPAAQLEKAAGRHGQLARLLGPLFGDVLLDLRPR